MKRLPQSEIHQIKNAMIWVGDVHTLLIRADALSCTDADLAADTRDDAKHALENLAHALGYTVKGNVIEAPQEKAA